MEIILKQDMPGLGDKDDIISVKNGYGRNYLIPKGIGILASTDNTATIFATNNARLCSRAISTIYVQL